MRTSKQHKMIASVVAGALTFGVMPMITVATAASASAAGEYNPAEWQEFESLVPGGDSPMNPFLVKIHNGIPNIGTLAKDGSWSVHVANSATAPAEYNVRYGYHADRPGFGRIVWDEATRKIELRLTAEELKNLSLGSLTVSGSISGVIDFPVVENPDGTSLGGGMGAGSLDFQFEGSHEFTTSEKVVKGSATLTRSATGRITPNKNVSRIETATLSRAGVLEVNRNWSGWRKVQDLPKGTSKVTLSSGKLREKETVSYRVRIPSLHEGRYTTYSYEATNYPEALSSSVTFEANTLGKATIIANQVVKKRVLTVKVKANGKGTVWVKVPGKKTVKVKIAANKTKTIKVKLPKKTPKKVTVTVKVNSAPFFTGTTISKSYKIKK